MLEKLLLTLAVIGLVWNGAMAKIVTSPSPQMGWNSWNKFACNISESLIKETADALVNTGLAGLGYNYLNLDDCWQNAKRNADGTISADAERFPSGIKALSDYVHSKGLKFGIYSSAGFKTCQGFPAGLGVEEIDANTYASWGVDYLKYDNCYEDRGLPQHRFSAMASALESSGRDIFYSLCEWGRENPAVWGGEFANSWRISPDITDGWTSIISRAEIAASLWRFAGPSTGWNDPDMLEVGNGKCSEDEYRTHFSLWAMLKAPLIVGNDIRELSADSSIVQMLGNKEVIAINQDALGRQGRIVWSDTMESFLSKINYGDRLIATKCVKGAAASAGTYSDSHDAQEWTFDAATKQIKSSSTGKCLNEVPNSVISKVEELIGSDHFKFEGLVHGVTTADCATATHWEIDQHVGGLIVSQTTGNCLEVSKMELIPILQGKRIQTAPCQATPKDHNGFDVREHQSWSHPTGATNTVLKNLYQRQCLTVDRDAYPGVKQEIWLGELADGSFTVLLINKGKVETKIELTTEKLGLNGQNNIYQLHDLWEHADLTQRLTDSHSMNFLLRSHASVMLRLTPAK